MFSFGGGLLAGQHDCKKERPPPSRPIPVTFPSLNPPKPSLQSPPSAWGAGPSSAISAHFLSLKRPSDVSLETLALLNISFVPPCDFETLVPSTPNGSPVYLPPTTWLEAPEAPESEAVHGRENPARLRSNDRKVPDRTDFYMRAKELFYRTEDAFAALTRKPNPGQVPPRLAYFRKFWEALDNLAYYWDNSLDEYLPPKEEHATTDELSQISTDAVPSDRYSDAREAEARVTSASSLRPMNIEEPRKKAKTDAVSNGTTGQDVKSSGFDNSGVATQSRFIASSTALPARAAPPKVPWAVNAQSISEKPTDLSKGSYRGYRIGNGAEMPDQYRLDCVRAFLEPIAWAFAVNFVPHRRPPVLCLEQVRFPVRMNSVGWKAPADRFKARQGWMEGPVIGIQCRPEIRFGATGDIQAESVLDVLRELGGMLLLAQERAREGKTEIRAGEGKWWTRTPRWGGGPGGEIGEAATASGISTQDGPAPKAGDQLIGRPRPGSKDRRRQSPVEMWKVVKPGNPLWDPKIVYEAIGKDRESDWDEIFMVSSLNHHISVLKLRVHRLYIEHLLNGSLPLEKPTDPSWCSPSLQRTRWYDLFSVEDRTEAMRGLWGVMAYLMRPQDEHKADVAMKED